VQRSPKIALLQIFARILAGFLEASCLLSRYPMEVSAVLITP
jgi:hypothetical protein